MLGNRMICHTCVGEIPYDSLRLLRNGEPSDYDDEIECPHCRTLNLIHLAQGRGLNK